jgi:hypothetical protein
MSQKSNPYAPEVPHQHKLRFHDNLACLLDCINLEPAATPASLIQN